MKLNAKYKVRRLAGENVVVMQGRYGADMTRIIALNDSSCYLWESLAGREFDIEDVVRLLTERYGIDTETARRDGESWIASLEKNNILE